MHSSIIYNIHNLKNQKIDFSSTNRRFSLVFFTTVSAFVFLNFFQPFGLYYDENIPAQEVFVELFMAMTLVFVVLIISQFVLRPVFKADKLTITGLVGWFFIEAILASVLWTFLDILIKNGTQPIIFLWLENLAAYSLIMVLPYFLFLTYTYFRDALSATKEKEQVLIFQQHIAIKDEAGGDKLVVDVQNLIYIKSADNYVEVYYTENNMLTKILVRNTIKKLEKDLSDTPVIRCHRSYMINSKKIESAKKTTAGFDVKLQRAPESTIPVSRSYVSELKKQTTSFN
jgi:DNA-binding LytR/AlgR family response regulator